jgi:class 3 adenylate cyclase/carbon monoxide dehydrogenase subunit G
MDGRRRIMNNVPAGGSSMPGKQFEYRWQWDLEAAPEALWRFVADTNRFNRDTGLPVVQRLGAEGPGRHLRFTKLGVPVEWDEEPFEWVRPQSFGVVRHYRTGPVAEMRVRVQLSPREGGGTRLTYDARLSPRGVLGHIAIPVQVGLISARAFEAAFRKYDRIALAGQDAVQLPAQRVRFAPGGKARLELARDALVRDGAAPVLVEHLRQAIETADELTAARMQPYALAQEWGAARKDVLELCLRATRAGLLELRWELLCPLCRGAGAAELSLRELPREVHCESCHIDYSVRFDESVELTFHPSPAVRPIEVQQFCVGGPMITPHIAVQQRLEPGERRVVSAVLEPGRYRLRTGEQPGGVPLSVRDDGKAEAELSVAEDGLRLADERLAPHTVLTLHNATARAQLVILERTAWSDLAATALEVTALQAFRDLFSAEALRPGEQISVGSVTVLFTDLRGSTDLYRDIGDAPAFGLVMEHFAVLREAIDAEGGALVKTIGDAVMAAFRRPAPALCAMLVAQRRLAAPAGGLRPLSLKAGIHSGPCIAVTLNERLDYFGSTVNAAARLEGLSSGTDVVVSDAVRCDPEVEDLVASGALCAEPFEARLKGFAEQSFRLWRITGGQQGSLQQADSGRRAPGAPMAAPGTAESPAQ